MISLPKIISITITMLSFLLSMHISNVSAGMIGTEHVVSTNSLELNKQKIHQALLRDDVKKALLNHGVTPEYAQARVNQLTDQEINILATQLDDLPAASGVGLILFASGPIVFMLELMGFTDLTTTF